MTAELIALSRKPARSSYEEAGSGHSKVLLVDDDPLQRESAICHLSGPDLTIQTAGDGEEGWLQLEERTFDAALIDLDMPQLDGLALIARIRAEPKHRDMPILVVSGCEDQGVLDQAYKDGIFVFCLKPVSWRLLKVQLEHALDMVRLKRLGYFGAQRSLAENR